MFLVAASFVSVAAGPADLVHPGASPSNLGGVFTENVGQWSEHVLYHGRFNQYDVSVTRDGVVIHHYALDSHRGDETPKARIESVTMRVGEGGFRSVRAQGRDNVHVTINDKPTSRYRELMIETSIPGVALALGADDGQMRYDFHLDAGVPASAVSVAFDGVKAPAIRRDALVFQTALGEVRHGELRAFQPRSSRDLPVRFRTRIDGSIGFEVEGADPSRPLVIDPLIYGSYFGGRGADEPTGMDIGPAGDIFVCGRTFSFGFNPFGFVQGVRGGFVAMLDSGKGLSKLAQVFGVQAVGYNDIAAMPDGDVVVVGTADGNLFSHNALSAHNGQTMGLVARFRPAEFGLSLVNGGFFGGSGATIPRSVSPMPNDTVLVVGSTASTASWTSASTVGTAGTLGGTSDAFLLRVNVPGGAWSLSIRAFIGGSSADVLNACATHPNFPDIILFGGTTNGTGLTAAPSFFDQTSAGEEGFMGAINLGFFPLSIDLGFVGGDGNDSVTDMAVSSQGVVVLVGTTQNAPGFPHVSPLQDSTSAGTVAFMTYGPGIRSPMISTWLGGDAQLQPSDVDIDAMGQVHIAGRAGVGFNTSLGAVQTDFGGVADAFYTRFGFQQVPGLTFVNPGFHYSTYLGGSSDEQVGGVKANGGEVLVVAQSAGGFPVSVDGQSQTPNGSFDVVIAAIRPAVTDFPVVANLPPGGSGVGFAGITGPMPFDVTIQLASSSSKLKLPETVVVRAGQTQSPFMMSTQDVLSTETVTVSAFWEGQLRQAFMDIAAPAFGGVINLDGANGPLRPTTVALEFREAGHPDVLITKVVAVAPDGTFLTDAPSNRVFDVSVKPGHWLRRTVRFDTRPGAISGAAISLLNGDCNGDNTVSIADFLLLRQAFGASAGDPRFNPNADLNRDGSIGIGDFLLLRRNFGRSGDQ